MAFVLSLCFVGSIPASGEEHISANYYLPFCRDLVNGRSDINPFQQGLCAGTIDTLASVAKYMPLQTARSCTPEDDTVSVSQMTAVVVRWLDERPQRWNENFKNLVLSALHDAWPCRK
jgi:hypothetical protein